MRSIFISFTFTCLLDRSHPRAHSVLDKTPSRRLASLEEVTDFFTHYSFSHRNTCKPTFDMKEIEYLKYLYCSKR